LWRNKDGCAELRFFPSSTPPQAPKGFSYRLTLTARCGYCGLCQFNWVTPSTTPSSTPPQAPKGFSYRLTLTAWCGYCGLCQFNWVTPSTALTSVLSSYQSSRHQWVRSVSSAINIKQAKKSPRPASSKLPASKHHRHVCFNDAFAVVVHFQG
jgi:hypothetical protein